MSNAAQELELSIEDIRSKEEKKLTDWANEPMLRQLKADYTNGQHTRNEIMMKVWDWRDAFECTGKYSVPKVKGRSTVQPKLIRKQAEWRYAALSEPFLSSSDLFEVSPVSHEDRKAARQNSLILNNQFQTKINKVRFIDDFVRRAVNEGTVIVRVGWDYQEKPVEEEFYQYQYLPVPPEAQEQAEQQLQQLMDMKVNEPDGFTQIDPAMQEMVRVWEEEQQIVIPQVVGRGVRQVMKPVVNKPSLEVCDIEAVTIDPTCEGDIEKAEFLVYSFVSSLSELKKAGIYQNLDQLAKDPGKSMGMPDGEFIFGSAEQVFRDKPRQKLYVYEYWGYWDIDGNGETKPIVATWAGNTLIRLEENPYPDGKIPFVVVPYLPVKNSVYGEPDGALLIDHQRVIGAVTRGMIDLLGKSANSQTGIPVNLLDSQNLKKFLAGQDYQYNANLNPQLIYQHTYPEVPASAMNLIQYMAGDAEALTGVKAFSTGGGITGEGMGESATGVRSAMDAASKREMGILRRLSDGIIQIGRKIISMNAAFLNEEEIVRITNDSFVKVRRDDLPGNFDLKLTISTAEADNEKAQELAYMLQTMGNNMAPEMSQLILGEIARLRNMPDLARAIENYKPEPDPMQQQMQQLELEKMQAEIDAIRADAMKGQAQAEVNMSKVGTEQAKANKTQNEADLKSLDFTEQMNGIKHNQAKELKAIEGQNQLAIAGEKADASLEQALLNNSAKVISDANKTRNSKG
jgi:N4 gp59-like protein|nr:MAG TPA: Portal protein [Caudoviricetes sp.]